MAIYFFDASALVKQYVNESGTHWVQSITDPQGPNSIYIAEVTGAEVVVAIRARASRHNPPTIFPADAIKLIANFKSDFEKLYRPIGISTRLIRRAMDLADKHVLRGYDSIQLSVAYDLNANAIANGSGPVTFLSADNNLNNAAQAEGLIVDNPSNH